MEVWIILVEGCMKAGVLYIAVVMIIVVVSGCVEEVGDSNKQLSEVSVKFNGFYSVQFAGFFTAEERGYYAANGLKVTFVPPGSFQDDALEAFDSGEVDFAVVPATDLVAHSDGGLVAVAAVYQRNPNAYISLGRSDIHTPFDLEGRRIGYHDQLSREKLLHLASELSLNSSSMEPVPVGRSLEPLINGSVDVYMGSVLDEALRLKWTGYDTNVILEEDYGLNEYGSVIVVRREFITENPGAVQSFLNATLAGWTYAVEHPVEALNYTLPYMGTGVFEQQLDAMKTVSSMVYTGEHPIGWMEQAVWKRTVDLMQELGFTNITDATTVYDQRFLYDIYGVDAR